MEWFSNFIGLTGKNKKINRKELDKKFKEENPLILGDNDSDEFYLKPPKQTTKSLFTDDMLKPNDSVEVDKDIDEEIKKLFNTKINDKKRKRKEDIFSFDFDKYDIDFKTTPVDANDFKLEEKKSDGKILIRKRNFKKY